MVTAFFEIVFFATIFLCLSTYVGYPLIIWIAGELFPFKAEKSDFAPYVSIIISAFNEGKSLRRKLVNTLALDYPRDRLEILLGSDGSNDETRWIGEEFVTHGIKFYHFSENRGKTAVQNDLVKESNGTLLVFTDAASFMSPDALRKIVANFADSRVGCVGATLSFIGTKRNLTAQSQGIYWKYESRIREMESKIGSLIGVDGPLYAIRKEAYVHLESDAISDLLSPLLVLEKGWKVVLEEGAKVDEEIKNTRNAEFRTRRRIVSRGFLGIWKVVWLLNVKRNPKLALQIIFHKLIRWLVGPLLLLNVMACIALINRFPFNAFLVVYFYILIFGAIGLVLERLQIKSKVLSVAFYFLLVNIAATMGLVDFLRRKKAVSWVPVRD